jgi:hypothetical protein
MPSVDGIRTSQRHSAPSGKRARKPQRAEKRSATPAPRPPERTAGGEESRRFLLYLFVGIAAIGIGAFWFSATGRRFSRIEGGDSFFSSVAQQIREVFSGSNEDFAQAREALNSLDKDEVERLEERVFPALPQQEE